jgi:hypothetical protein
MPSFFTLFTVIVIGISIFSVGVLLLTKTEYTLQKMIDIVGMNKNSFQYEFMTNKKNLIHYRMIGIIFILFGMLSIVLPILKTISH